MSELEPLPGGLVYPLRTEQRRLKRKMSELRNSTPFPSGVLVFLLAAVATEFLTMTQAVFVGALLLGVLYGWLGFQYLHVWRNHKGVSAALARAEDRAKAIEREHMTFGGEPSIFENMGGRHPEPEDAFDCRMCIAEAERIADQRRDLERRSREARGKSTKNLPKVSTLLEKVLREMMYAGTKAVLESLPHGTGCECPSCKEQR